MSGKSKLTLFLEMKDRLFNNRLSQTKKRFDRATGRMQNRVRGLRATTVNAFKDMQTQLPLFGRAVELLGNPYTLIAAGLFSVVSLFGQATGKAKEFNSEFLHIKQLNLDKNVQELNTYKTLIRDSAFETGKNLALTTKSYYDLQSALGAYGAEARTIFTQVANYSTATGANLGDSINSVSKAMKAFNLEAKDSRKIILSNAKAVQVGITTFDELSKVQTDYAGSSGNIGQSIDTANKVFTAFTAIGKSSAEAGTLTKTFFQGLAQRATQIEKYLKIKVFDEKGSFKQADTILTAIGLKFQDLSQKQVAELITKIGGPDGLNQLLTKMKGNAGDVINTFSAFDSSKFDLEKALKNAKLDAGVLSSMVKNKLNIILSKLGEKILPVVVKFLDKADKILDYLYKDGYKVYTLLKQFTITMIAFKTATALVNMDLKFMAFAFKYHLTNGISSAKMAFKSFDTAIKANGIGLVVAAITLLITKLIEAGNQLERIKEKHLEKHRNFKRNVSNIITPTNTDLGLTNLKKLSNRQAGDINQRTITRLNELKDIRAKLTAALSTENPNAKHIVKFNRELNHLKKVKNPTYDQKKRLEQLKWDIDQHVKEITKGFTLTDINKAIRNNESILGRLKNKGFKFKINDDDNGTNSSVSEDIKNTTTQASQPRSITVNIEALNKGGINTHNTTLAHKSAEELEEWFNEMMLRVIRNVELSNG